jgi:hypothetical protein
MPRRKATTLTTEESFSAEPLAAPTLEAPAASDVPANGEKNHAKPDRKLSSLPDPYELKTVTLGSSNADPKMRLLRSFRYRQMQIRFEQDPDDKYKAILHNAGWRDRTEEEGIWTKQIPKDSGWQPAADAERLFKQIANEIRADKGMGTVMNLG